MIGINSGAVSSHNGLDRFFYKVFMGSIVFKALYTEKKCLK